MSKEKLEAFISEVAEIIQAKGAYKVGRDGGTGSPAGFCDEAGFFSVKIHAPSKWCDASVAIDVDIGVYSGIEDDSPASLLGHLAMRLRALADAITPPAPAVGLDVPYGFQLGADGRTLEPCASEQRVIARVRELRAAGLSQRAIAEDLAKAGLLPEDKVADYPHIQGRD